MAGAIIDGEARPSAVPQLRSPPLPLSDEVDARGRLEAAVERQTSLREAADRALARAREDHEDAFESLLARCRALETEKASWVEAGFGNLDDLARIRAEHRDALTRQTAEAERILLERVGELEQHLAHVQREAEHSVQVATAERDRIAAEREADRTAEAERILLERVGELEQHLAHVQREAKHSVQVATAERDRIAAEREADLAEAEGRFRIEAFRLSAVVALRTKEIETALARIEEERAGRESAERQFAAVTASSSWKLGRPMRVLGRALRRVLRRGG